MQTAAETLSDVSSRPASVRRRAGEAVPAAGNAAAEQDTQEAENTLAELEDQMIPPRSASTRISVTLRRVRHAAMAEEDVQGKAMSSIRDGVVSMPQSNKVQRLLPPRLFHLNHQGRRSGDATNESGWQASGSGGKG